ncbi:MAG: hypothetical protein U5L00_02260 [Desulfovermiculus sp.]|nr:hypothetical protein [Desulfovermiculus sp.]
MCYKSAMSNSLLRFEVPFLPDEDYTNFLAAHSASLACVYFSLHAPTIPDARVGIAGHSISEILRLLPKLPRRLTKYALLNSRFQAPAHILDQKYIDTIISKLNALHQAECLTGIVYVDHYLLQALSDRAPNLCAQLEAVPGANCLLDSLPRISGHLEFIAQTAFKLPGKLVLDRTLNRDLSRLREMSQGCATLWPQMRLGLLANEGCLPNCPYKLTHDATISLGRMDPTQEKTHTMNTSLGCARTFLRDPALILRSPFIRPEDISAYSPYVQDIKLGGRTRGADVMRKVLSMYIQRSYSGNLLELLDTQEFLADRLFVANQDLPPDFGYRTIDCGLRCYSCSYCHDLAAAHVQDLGVHIKPMWV